MELMRLKKFNWRRWRWITLLVLAVTICFFVFMSNLILYLSHQRFPVLAWIQWNHSPGFVIRDERPVIVGHRGSGLNSTNPNAKSENHLIGNTRNAIQTAIDAKADWIEIDIRVSQDGKLVVFHDRQIDAKTTGNGTVESQDLKDLKSYDVLVDPPEKILSLTEVFDEFHVNERRWILDIKVDGIVDRVNNLLEESGIPKEQIIIFANHEVLKAYMRKGYRLGYTTLFNNHRRMLFSQTDVFKRCKDNSIDLLVVPVAFVTPNFVANARDKNIDVWSYDSNDPRDLQYCAECGVRGLIVDAPGDVMSQFSDWSNGH